MSDRSLGYFEALKIKKKYEDILLLKKGVIGCGIGLDKLGKLGIVVYILEESSDIPTKIENINVFIEEVQPDEKWKEEGHITVASIQDLSEVTQDKIVANQLLWNKVDAAISKLLSIDLVVPEILGLGIPKGIRAAYPGMQVRKSGRTTGVTEAKVVSCDVSLFVSYPGHGTALFKEQIATTPMAKPGDSGSLTIDSDLYAIGLLFAQIPRLTFHNKIQNVLDALNIEIWTDELTPELKRKILDVNSKYRNGKRRTERWRPAPMGVSFGHYKGGTGTAGCLVKNRKTKEILILTNAHVAAMPTRQE